MGSRKEIRIGTSGYQYDHWTKVFYPEKLPKKEWFNYYAKHLDSVEMNSTFYRLPKTKTFEGWRERAPQGFRYILKYSRYGTHIKRLKDPADHVGTFLERAEHLKSSLGPILVQIPPNWKARPDRLDAFLEAAPDRRRWAIEIRDPSWFTDEVFHILEKHNAALCLHDMLPDHPDLHTADWVYLRYHGPNGDYTGQYSSKAIEGIARKIDNCHDSGLDVFCFFNNDQHGYAVENALDLKQLLN